MLRVSVTPEMKTPAFHLVSVDAQPIRAVELTRIASGDFIGVIEPPRGAFRVMALGRDESGLTVQRMKAGLFHSESIEIVPPEGRTAAAGATVPVTFTIRNYGLAVHLQLIASDGTGTVLPVDPPTLDLAAGAEGAATVRLRVPAERASSSEAGIRLTATSDENAAVGGFNSAQETYRIVPVPPY